MSKYRILSMDGGGIRGLLTTTLLERLDSPVTKLIENVDLIAGTSTGGIIALGLAFGLSPATITSIYRDHGSEIFDDSWLHDIHEMHGLMGAHYDNVKLVNILTQHFGTTTLNGLPKKVLIPTFNFHATNPNRWEPVFMHNMVGGDGSLSIVETAMRTSAAPTYFPSWGTFLDGGVACNDPSMAAVAQAVESGVALEDIVVISLGTGVSLSFIDGSDMDKGDFFWIQPLIQILLDSGAPVAEKQCRQILKDRYLRLNPDFPPGIKIALDDYSRGSELISIANGVDISTSLTWLQQQWA